VSPMISVIIPVYNADMYLSDCMSLFCRQSFVDIEVILINDGSRDDSGNICQSYAEKDSRIIYLEQENKGVSEARNAGLTHCARAFCRLCGRLMTGWISHGLQVLLDEYKLHEADLVVANMSFVEGNHSRCIEVFDRPFTTDDPEWINRYQHGLYRLCYNPNPGTKYNITGLGQHGQQALRSNNY